jgi:hypothetical protein
VIFIVNSRHKPHKTLKVKPGDLYCKQRSPGFTFSVLWGLCLLFTIKITWFHLQCIVGFVSTVYNKDHMVSPPVFCEV